MDVWLDDVRPAPPSWTWVQTVEEVTELLATGSVEALSLDNDLGPGMTEGYKVVQWMEQNGFWPELLCVHTNNAVAGRYMRDVIQGTGMYSRPVPVEFRVEITEDDIKKMKLPDESEQFRAGQKVSFPALMFNLTQQA